MMLCLSLIISNNILFKIQHYYEKMIGFSEIRRMYFIQQKYHPSNFLYLFHIKMFFIKLYKRYFGSSEGIFTTLSIRG